MCTTGAGEGGRGPFKLWSNSQGSGYYRCNGQTPLVHGYKGPEGAFDMDKSHRTHLSSWTRITFTGLYRYSYTVGVISILFTTYAKLL